MDRTQALPLHDVIQPLAEQSGLTPLLQILIRAENDPHRLQVSLFFPVLDHLCQTLLVVDLHPLRVIDDDGPVMDIFQQPVLAKQIFTQIILINAGAVHDQNILQLPAGFIVDRLRHQLIDLRIIGIHQNDIAVLPCISSGPF